MEGGREERGGREGGRERGGREGGREERGGREGGREGERRERERDRERVRERERERERERNGEIYQIYLLSLSTQDLLVRARLVLCCAISTTHLRTRSRDLSPKRRSQSLSIAKKLCWTFGTLQVN